jgi:hypothetical protein
MSNVLEYPKIETLFNRGPDHKVIEGQVRCPEFALIKRWVVTEKIDGTNIRIALEPPVDLDDEVDRGGRPLIDWRVHYYGRTSAAQIPTFLLAYLQDAVTFNDMRGLWRGRRDCASCAGYGHYPGVERCECFTPYPITLYGEGYGPRIQKGGGNYRDTPGFRLFDVRVGDKWLNWTDVKGIAGRLNLKAVPEIFTDQVADVCDIDTLASITMLVKGGFNSAVAQDDRPDVDWNKTWVQAEGVVARTEPYLFDWRRHPLRFKLKAGDFA